MDKKILIVGHVEHGLAALKIAELTEMHPECEVVSIEEAKERGLSETFQITKLPDFPEPILIQSAEFYSGMSARSERRKKERDLKKAKKRGRF